MSVDDIASPVAFPCIAGFPGTCDSSVTKERTFTLR